MASVLAVLLATPTLRSAEGERILFNRDVRPILAEKCFHCHGPDAHARQADLRLDQAENALAPREGFRIITPGRPEESDLYNRVTATADAVRMPPPDQERQLTADEISVLRRWIEQGAEYEPHWAFIPPERTPIPAIGDPSWARNAIDRFIQAELTAHKLRPSPAADRPTLIRRVTLDLTGLPPTVEEVDAFLSDAAPDAYERLVDRLLASPRYGERMALDWLDAARYADSGGYQGDILRTMWPWRHWVIAALNANLTFDQFSIEQLAGDLLPDPTRDQFVATGFHRNHRINDEDGIIPEEFRVEYVSDRVETTATVWLGLTLGCARCHDHKYDPLSQREYYGLYAFFNSVDEQGRGHGNAPPVLRLPTPEQESRLGEIDRELTQLRQSADEHAEQIKSLEEQRNGVEAGVVTTMIMRDLPEPRATFVLTRGAYDKPADPVPSGTPAALPPPAAKPTSNRLELARWLFAPDHPLTARVAVNRIWQLHFGRGLVGTPEDFGTQGELPSHPALLEWLATELVRTGWDIKGLQRLIVTSATYRQSSAGSEELVRIDPENRLLARGSRFRLPAETLRDQALFASGLLEERLGGPSVKPYQPPGLWEEMASASSRYVQDHGADLYRRGLYTFVRRTITHPGMAVLDAPNRELCAVRRPRTNTPTQALNLMNDPAFVEAARSLAERALDGGATDHHAMVSGMFRRILARAPSTPEADVLRTALEAFRGQYRDNPAEAQRLIDVGESKPAADQDPVQLAALTAVAGLILNLDETLVRE
jgi:hypothetical protein